MTAREVVLWLPFDKPPLTANQRMHWAPRSELTKRVRMAARALAGVAGLPRALPRVRVGLAYFPKDNRRRDADNLVPTLKAACDGLVDYGLVDDDTPDLMEKGMPVIHPAHKEGPGPNEERVALIVTLP